MRAKYKIVFLGDANVGKTTLISQYVYKQCDQNYNPTIGIDFICTKLRVQNKEVKLQLWDTAGQERFNSLIPNYTRDSFMSLVVCDITNRQSIEKIKYWVEELVWANDPEKKSKLLIVANKKDLKKNNENTQLVCEIAKFYKCGYVETNGLVNEDIQLMTDEIVKCIEVDVKNSGNVVDLMKENFKVNLKPKQRRCC